METKFFDIDKITDSIISVNFPTPRLQKMLGIVTSYINEGGSYNETKISMNKLNFGFDQTRGNGFIRVLVFDRLEGAKYNYKFMG